MTGTKRSTLLQSSLLSPTSSKLTSQYIVKNNLAHHYRILQNVSSCIDNSTPQSLLKSQKIRDKNKHKKRPASRSSASSLTRSRPASQTQQEMYYRNTYNLQEDWKEAFKDVADDDELYQIVRATLGRKPDHSFMTEYYSDDGSKDGYYGFNQSSRLSSYDDRYSASSNFPPSRQSQAFSSISRSMINSRKSSHLLMKDKPGDVLQSRTHVFTQPEKAFTPRILKTSKKSLLSECKYYNPPRLRKSKAESESQKDKKEKHSDQSETSNYLDPESLTESTSYISSRSSKSHSTLVEEPVPQLDLLPDKEGRSDKTKVKKDTRNNTKENIILEDENSDLKNTTLNRHKSKLNPTDNAFKQTSTQNSSKTPSDLYQSNATSSHLQSPKALNEINKSSECEYINFMKHVTEDILLKGLFTNRAIQQVFEFHIMKHRGKLDEGKMRRMLMNFLQDIGIKPERDATFNGNTSTSNELNNFPSYSGLNLSENLSKSISLMNKSEECHQKNLEKLMTSMSDFNVSQTEENLVKENPQPEVSLARKQRHQSSYSKQRNDINVVIANPMDEDTEINKVTRDEKQIVNPDGDKMNFTKDCDNKQNNKPVPRPRRKNSSPNILQESAHVHMTSIVKTLDPDIYCEKAAGDSIVSKDSFQENTASVDISLKPADYVSEMKTSEPVKTANNLTMSNSSNMMNLASDKSDGKSQLEPNSVYSESSPNHEPTANPSQINQSPDSPVNNHSDNQVDEQNDYDEDNFDSVDSDSDF
ncbi:spermatogenesis-associated protein 7 homolog [Octopus sinensis]|uniref:Spermatogenesis-associated protein 7 homolog n=1 Tax=Octopus sinensis TaxID=2607531 RepID=A0A6P7SZ03_9MOLL|nr:spermatogenesis-associated protein 7 homolog [Octopus sinensis]XP_036363340.1 spermatogenesis-associated protein 7 homolog [Octopus sinensis]